MTTVTTTESPVRSETDPWWRSAVIYQIYPRSFADSNGDGMGDLQGIIDRLPYVAGLGVDAIWISPFYPSPMADAGYDVADYRGVDPIFGTLQDADRLLQVAHSLHLKVIVDLVPNHSSDEHVWFQAALRAAPGSPERDRYMFRDGRGADGSEPPNNWRSVFGGPAWTRVTEADGRPGQWYLHLFDAKQPDWNWQNPEVRAEFESILRFWLDRGVDGFRVDVAHALVKDAALPDWDAPEHGGPMAPVSGFDAEAIDTVLPPNHPGQDSHWESLPAGPVQDAQPSDTAQTPQSSQTDEPGNSGPMWDQDGVHEIYEQWRRIADSYGAPDRIFVAEAWVQPASRAARYIRPTELHQAFNFDFLETPWDAVKLVTVIHRSLAAAALVDAPTTWVLSNHDVVRHASRLGLDQNKLRPNGIRASDPQPDAELGLRRARADTALMLALPGAAYLYQGEELGLPEDTDLPDAVRQDPTFFRTEGAEAGRDGCRIPMPWAKDAPGLGFGPSEETWLPQPASYADLAVDQQDGVAGSTLELYRELLRLRRELDLGAGELTWGGADDASSQTGSQTVSHTEGMPDGHADARAGIVRFTTRSARGAVTVIANVSSASPVELPADATVLAASGPLDGAAVPPDTTVWLRA